MNRSNFILAAIFIISTACTNKPELKEEKVLFSGITSFSPAAESGKIDLDESEISWRGTKLLKTSGHNGIIKLKDGYLTFKDGSLTGGKIIVDMNTISITDFSNYSEEDMKRLSNHLKKKEFNVAEYPEAIFEITAVDYLKEGDLLVKGRMSIKDITKNISVPAVISQSGNKFHAGLSLNRLDYNIGIDGNLLEKNLVDDEFQLKIELAVKR